LSVTVAPWAVGLAARWSEVAEKGSRWRRTPAAGIIGARSHFPTRFPVWASEVAPEPSAIILLITFGSAVAMGPPLLTALFGLGIATAIGELLRRVFS